MVAPRAPWLVLLLGACAGAPPVAAVPGSLRERIVVQFEFEPPLREPTLLHYAHECGEQGEVRTGCSGVELRLLPGPVALAMVVDGRRRELAVTVRAGLPPMLWRIDG